MTQIEEIITVFNPPYLLPCAKNKEYGSGEIYVYKRPHLREFLLKVAQLG